MYASYLRYKNGKTFFNTVCRRFIDLILYTRNNKVGLTNWSYIASYIYLLFGNTRVCS